MCVRLPQSRLPVSEVCVRVSQACMIQMQEMQLHLQALKNTAAHDRFADAATSEKFQNLAGFDWHVRPAFDTLERLE